MKLVVSSVHCIKSGWPSKFLHSRPFMALVNPLLSGPCKPSWKLLVSGQLLAAPSISSNAIWSEISTKS